LVPTIGLFAQIMAGEASAHGLTPEVGGYMNIPELLENSIHTHTELRKRGIRHLIGGDYGFGWSKQGTQGRDLEFFVDHFGYSTTEALLCATRNGGQAMGYDDLGTLEPGNLADLILIDGDPLADIAVLAGPEKVVFVMKGGAIHKSTLPIPARGLSPVLQAAE
jgi:imidazolonepropionase-like amidohydrolase